MTAKENESRGCLHRISLLVARWDLQYEIHDFDAPGEKFVAMNATRALEEIGEILMEHESCVAQQRCVVAE